MLFAEFPARAPQAKEHLFKKYVAPTYGSDPDRYFAVESNQDTRAMYKRLNIKAQHLNEYLGTGPAPEKPVKGKPLSMNLSLF